MRAAGDLAIAIVPDLVERVQPGFLDAVADQRAEWPVHGGPDLVVVLEGKADAVDRCRRHEGRQDQAGQVEHLDGAAAQLRQHVGIAAQLVIGEKLNLHPPAGLFLDLGDRIAQPDVHRMIDDVVVGVAVGEFGGVAAARQDPEGSDAGGGKGEGAQNLAARQFRHERVPLIFVFLSGPAAPAPDPVSRLASSINTALYDKKR
jgi:hypothetical protein